MTKAAKTTKLAPAASVGINVQIPKHVHRSVKIALAVRGLTLSEAAAEAFSEWAAAAEGGRR